MRPRARLPRLLQRLRRLHGIPPSPPTRDPFCLLLWEQVGYLADDTKRLAAYRLLQERVGTRPTEILAAPLSTLRAVARRGGAIAVNQRAERLRAIANRVLAEWQGRLQTALALSLPLARRELTKYPAIGQAGAERILLFTGAHAVLGLDSNALRVLQRLGYGTQYAQWARSYRSTQAVAESELPRGVTARRVRTCCCDGTVRRSAGVRPRAVRSAR